MEDLHKQYEETATNRVKERFLLEEVAKEEKIEISDKDAEAKAEEMAKNYGMTKEDLLKEDAEIKLYNGFKEIKSNVESLLLDKKYNEALDAFATLRPLVDNLFDNVMVMDKDEAIKENRLGLLKQIYSTMLTICDLSKIVYK